MVSMYGCGSSNVLRVSVIASGLIDETLKGPVPNACAPLNWLAAIWGGDMPPNTCFGMIPIRSASGNDALGDRSVKTTRPEPAGATPTWRHESAPGCWYSRCWRTWNVNSTSSAEKGCPSAHLIPVRMSKVYERWLGEIVHVLARSPITFC